MAHRGDMLEAEEEGERAGLGSAPHRREPWGADTGVPGLKEQGVGSGKGER